MQQRVEFGRPQTFGLPAGETLTIACDAGVTAKLHRMSDQPNHTVGSAAHTATQAIAAGGSLSVGPFKLPRRYKLEVTTPGAKIGDGASYSSAIVEG